MKLSTGVILTAIGSIIVIVVANIIATEYRIKREREEREISRVDDLSKGNCSCNNNA